MSYSICMGTTQPQQTENYNTNFTLSDGTQITIYSKDLNKFLALQEAIQQVELAYTEE